MKKLILIFIFQFISTLSYANISSCEFKGVSVGDKINIPDVMHKLGVKNYKINPKKPDFLEEQKLWDQYGFLGASEISNNKIGNYCDINSCRIIDTFIGNKIQSTIFISFDQNTKIINAIEVSINQNYWNELVSIIKNKYKGAWNKNTSSIFISNYKTKKGALFDREEYRLKTPAKNINTGDSCEISAIEHDIIFEHPLSHLGVYQSIFDIQLISKNF